MRNKRIFVGITDVSGFGIRFKKGFEKIGLKSDFYSFTQHVYGFEPHKIITYSANGIIRKFQKIFLLSKLIIKYDYFLFIGINTLLKNYNDIKLFKFFGKTTMMVFTGCDLRIPDNVMHYRWNPCRECTKEYQDFVGCVIDRKKIYVREIEKVFDIIGAPFEAAGYLKAPYFNAIFPFDIDTFPAKNEFPYIQNKRLKIFHAPSNPVYKGTKYILDAVNKLKNKYDFEFNLVQNVSYDVYLNELSKSDLVIDQMLLGSYGSVAIEAFLFNKPVISYLRDDLWDVVDKKDCPVITADPDTILTVLESILVNPAQLNEIAPKGRFYVEKYHADAVAVKRFYDMFINYLKKDKPK